MNENLEFLSALIRNPLAVGALTPSGPDLARKMVEDVEPGPESIVLELGVGTGAVTRAIRDILPSPECYLGIELDERLAVGVRNSFPDLRIEVGCASTAAEMLNRAGLGRPRFIISSLPFVSLPESICDQILTETDKLMQSGCLFRTFQYAHGYYLSAARKLRDRMSRSYGEAERSPLVVRNVPPAYIYTWKAS